MATRRRTANRALPVDVQHYLVTGELPDDTDFELFALAGHNKAALRAAWDSARDEVLAEWIRDHPGTRPWAWWRFDAPREPLTLAPDRIWRDEDRTLPHRRRVGGVGTPWHEVWGCALDFDRGIPTQWFDAWMIKYYNGRAKDVHGNRIGTEYHDGFLVADAFDPADPPRFESEATYLERHGLLAPGERERLTEADFQPEVLQCG